MKNDTSALAAVAVAIGIGFPGLSSVASAVSIIGSSFGGIDGAVLYDVDPVTGLASNPRSTGIDFLVDIEFGSAGRLYGLSNSASPSNPASLFLIDPADGTSQLIGWTGLSGIVEGDLAFDSVSGMLYGLYDLGGQQRRLFTIDTSTGLASPLPGSLAGDPSGLTFDNRGTLYALDTSLEQLVTVDKITGNPLAFTALNVDLGTTAGMDVDPATGIIYVADGESGGNDSLFTLDATGVLTEIGPTGVPGGLAGLAVIPEPATLLMLLFGGLAVMRRSQRTS